MSFNRSILLPFQMYEQARAAFAKSIADLAQRSENVMVLNSAGVMPLLRPLLIDPVQSIQTSAALAIGLIKPKQILQKIFLLRPKSSG